MSDLETKSLIVKQSTIPNAGNGLFAKRDFYIGDIIGYLLGDIISVNQMNKIDSTGHPRRLYFVDLGNNQILDTYDSKSLTKYANDANGLTKFGRLKNNSYICITKNQNKAYIQASAVIRKGDEIFLDYGEDYWINYKYLQL